MGIPYYVASLLKTHKHIQHDIGNQAFEVDVLGIDFNCFIHAFWDETNPIQSILTALDALLTNTVRARLVYVAFDGLVPYAKMVQQRYRRFKTGPIEKHQISPGTPFMRELANAIRQRFPQIIVSDTLEAGEGEHKIFTWLRTQSVRNRICIYGLDADLVLISIAQRHLGDIYLLRDKSTFSVNALVKVLPIDPDVYVDKAIQYFGNDFMPTVAMYSLREDGYYRALQGATNETEVLRKRAKEWDRKIVAPDGHALEVRMGLHLFDGVVNWEPVVYAYWKTYAWTRHYFKTSEVLDWEWVYPYPEAPLFHALGEPQTEFTWEAPTPRMTVEDQLRFILPAASLQQAGLTPVYEDELYDEEKEVRHPWMKRFQWECDPYISCPHGSLTSVTELTLPGM
jgi:5'-3' exonuclease